MKRLWIAATSVALALVGACGPNNVGSTGGTGTTNPTGDGGTGGGSDAGQNDQNSCIPSDYACGGTSSLIYPGCPYGVSRGGVFPDFGLGEGYWNNATTPTDDIGLTTEQNMAFHLLYCSGFKYAFIDISAVWCIHCNEEAGSLPGYVKNPDGGIGTYEWNAATQTGWAAKWLPEGGIIFSLLEQGQNPQNAATPADLAAWVKQYNVNYPMAIDPQENVVSGVGLQAWPANIILNLATMQVVDAEFGDQPQVLTEMDGLLSAAQ
jgi:hypothetical protein